MEGREATGEEVVRFMLLREREDTVLGVFERLSLWVTSGKERSIDNLAGMKPEPELNWELVKDVKDEQVLNAVSIISEPVGVTRGVGIQSMDTSISSVATDGDLEL